jgi:hypothetical protein
MSADDRRGIGPAAERLLASLVSVKQDGRSACADNESVEELIRTDLAVRGPDGMMAITEVGKAHLARRALARQGSTIDPFIGQHLELAQAEIETAEGRSGVTLDASESPLAWLARRKGRDGEPLVGAIQFQAGERLRADFTRAHLMPRVTSNWTSSMARSRRGAHSMNLADAVIAARQRVHRALDSIGPEFSGLLVDVCCFLKRLEDCERERHWPQRSGKVVLRLGLDRLARHYGYGAEARGAKHAPVRTWLAPNASFAAGE